MTIKTPKTPRHPYPVRPDRRRWLGMLGGAGAMGAAAALAPVLPPAFKASAATLLVNNQRGLSGTWYDPATSGQGLVIEALPDLLGAGVGFVFGGWFTFSTEGGATPASQCWYTLTGELRDGVDAELVIYRNLGGRFDATPITFSAGFGSATLSFADCDTATLTYRFDDGRTGTIALQRLLPNAVCGTSGSSADVDFAYSGAWYDPDTSGQGLLVELNPGALSAGLCWYTYRGDGAQSAADPGQRWYTGQAVFAPGDRSMAFTLYASTGGQFDAPTAVTHTEVGVAELSFTSCSSAVLTYRFETGELAGRAGSIRLVRGAPAPGDCAFGTSCALIPSETEGPYPLSSVLADSTIVRSDITAGKTGVPLTLVLRLVNANGGCAPIANAAVYAWHCDKDGVYSGYANQTGGVDARGQTFLRGVQVSGSDGQVVFSTIYPGWYAGRITHIHFQVYLQNALGARATVTSQIAFPPDVTTAVYNSALYAGRGQNTSVTSFASDNVFRDGVSYQLANVAGTTSSGYVATLIVGIGA
ncbi:MAG: intradiol ring-cleavage dioxygenase [Xanthomonadales bacterium]|nr:intradiol ring-cleavage dioxygenase [Xanthomonadales bacterium]